jgi:hypothetical protein
VDPSVNGSIGTNGRSIAIKHGRLVTSSSFDDSVHITYFNHTGGQEMYAKLLNYAKYGFPTETTSDFSLEINDYLSTCTADSNGNCQVPLKLHSDTAGKIEISNINIQYTWDIDNLILTKKQWNQTVDVIANSSYENETLIYWNTSFLVGSNITIDGWYLNYDATSAKYDGSTETVYIGTETRIANNTGTPVDVNEIFGNYWQGQDFISTVTLLTKINLSIGKSGSPPDDLTIQLRNDNSSNPDTPDGTIYVEVNVSPSSIANGWNEIDIPDTELLLGEKYHIVLSCPNCDSLNKYYWDFGSSGEDGSSSLNGGISWTQADPLLFEVYGKNRSYINTTDILITQDTDLSFLSNHTLWDDIMGYGTPVVQSETSGYNETVGNTIYWKKNVTIEFYDTDGSIAPSGMFTNATTMTICTSSDVTRDEFIKVRNSTGDWVDITPTQTATWVLKTVETKNYYVWKEDLCYADGIYDFKVKIESN